MGQFDRRGVIGAGLAFAVTLRATRVAMVTQGEGGSQWVAFPTHEQIGRSVFDMVVAGRVVGDGSTSDVAIMMVEAEATVATIELIAGGAQAPTEEVVAAGLEAAKPFIRTLCQAQQELAAAAGSPELEFPTFPAYQPDALDAVRAVVADELAQSLFIAAKQQLDSRLDEVKAVASERLGDAFAGPEE